MSWKRGQYQEEEKCDTIEEVEVMSGDWEGVGQDQARRVWVDGNEKPLERLSWGALWSSLYFRRSPMAMGRRDERGW